MSEEPTPPIYSLPLFPLHFVLFPQFPLQLQVFEDRYRAMISECIERNQPFGVVLIAEGQETGSPAVPHTVGCVARILAVKTLDDGRMNLLAVGEKRFRLLEYSEADLPYLIGRVEALDDGAWSEAEPEKPLRDIHRLFKKYLRLLAECSGMSLPKLALPDDPTALGFCIAAVTQLPTTEKQRLLAMTDPQMRLKSEKRLLRQQIKELETLKSATEESTEPADAEEPEIRVIFAERLDPSSEFWTDYKHEARN
jgi:Lon protease-like protein